MPFRLAITTPQLHEIALRRDAHDVIALLWEIKRLRSLVLRANQVIRELPERGGPNGIVQESLRKDLLIEPCIVDEEKRRRESL
jgi:hypothetical protein